MMLLARPIAIYAFSLVSSLSFRNQTFSTRMLFSVIVPVLSVQITVVQPSVSIAFSFLTRALRLAMRWLPAARVNVTVGISPSGTSATMVPMANSMFCQTVLPISRPKIKKTAPILSAIRLIVLEPFSISCSSGLKVLLIPVVNRDTRPNWVLLPVAKTTPCPLPASTSVPEYTMLSASKSVPAAEGWAVLVKTSDSPVRVALLTFRSCVSTRRRSAGTLSPSCRITTSPSTSKSTGTSVISPARSAFACSGSRLSSASVAFSARYSWTKLKVPLIKIIATIAQPSVDMFSPGWK